MICPKCGEDNAESFRFCGMCGTLLEAGQEQRRPARTAAPDPLSARHVPAASPMSATAPQPWPTTVESAPKQHIQGYESQGFESQLSDAQPVPSISGPSMLGLNNPGPSIDSLREKSFSGMDSFLEPEEPKSGAGRVLLFLILLAALGAAGWWTYTNYLGVADSRRTAAATAARVEAPAEKPPTPAKPATQDMAPAVDSASTQSASPSAQVPEGSSENASATPAAPDKPRDIQKKAAPEEVAITPKSASPPAKTPPVHKSAAKREVIALSPKPAVSTGPQTPDTGDAAFRKGESYLYGRGVPENCDEAVRNLKAASAKDNARARSAFGTMYATGHCVPRDLPTSYLWFALALRVDPNNQILEKDLTAVWNQMTPPERQMAARMKQ